MKVGDIVYAKHPMMPGMTDMPGIIVKKEPVYKFGYRFQVMFPVVGLRWIKWSSNLIRFDNFWSEE